MKKNITLETVGKRIYYTYVILKFLIVLLNIFVMYFYFNGHPKFIILDLILNLIYIFIYIRRFWVIIPAILFCYYLTNNIFYSFVLGLSMGNTLSYIIDFIWFNLILLFMNFLERMSKK